MLRHVSLSEEDLVKVELGEDAPNRPQVDLLVVVFGPVPEDQLRGPEPPRDHIGREIVVGIDPLVLDRREPEITYAQLAFLVHEKVLRLDVSVNDARRVRVVEPSQQLIHEELLVVARDGGVQPDHIVQVGVHVVRHNVQLVEGLRILWQDYVMHWHDLYKAG